MTNEITTQAESRSLASITAFSGLAKMLTTETRVRTATDIFEDLHKVFDKMFLNCITTALDYELRDKSKIIKLLDPLSLYRDTLHNINSRREFLFRDLKPFFVEMENIKQIFSCTSIINRLQDFYDYVFGEEKNVNRLSFFQNALTPYNKNEASLIKTLKEVESKFQTTSTFGKDAKAYMEQFLEYSMIEFLPDFKNADGLLDVNVLKEKCDTWRRLYSRLTSNLAFLISSECFLFELKNYE